MNLEEKAYDMFDKLSEHTNEEVTYELWSYGRQNKKTDTLVFIQSFKGFGTGKKFVPFISEREAIKSINLKETGELLYKNPYIKSGFGKNKEDVEAHIRDIFGDKIADEYAVEKRVQAEREKIVRIDEELDIISKKNKLEIIKEGLQHINQDLIVEWVNHADEFGNNAFGSYIISKSINCMKKMNDNASFDELDEYINKASRNSIIEIAIAGDVIRFGKNGSEFGEYFSNKYGFNNEKKSFSSLK